MSLVAITTALVIWAPAQDTKQATYDEALVCSAITQAASELEGGESRYGRSLADAALYWTLTYIQNAQVRGINSSTADRTQSTARIDYVRRLTRQDPAARRKLLQCRQKTPRLG